MTQIDELTVNRPGWTETEDPVKHLPYPVRFFALDAGDGGYVIVDSVGDEISASASKKGSVSASKTGWFKEVNPLKRFKGISQTNLDAALDFAEQH